MDLNRATLIGRLTRDPELRSLPSGKTVTTFGLATGRMWTDAQGQKQKQTEFHNIVMWGKMGENANQYLRKGGQVFIEGRLQTREWTAQDGTKRQRTEIVADSMIMLGSKPTGGAGPAPIEASGAGAMSSAAPSEVVEEEIKVEDIPF